MRSYIFIFLFKVAKFVEDPLIYHGKMRFCWVNAIINSLNTLEESLHKITLPTLIIHGSEDPIIPISSSEHIYEKISSIDKIVEVSAVKSVNDATNNIFYY